MDDDSGGVPQVDASSDSSAGAWIEPPGDLDGGARPPADPKHGVAGGAWASPSEHTAAGQAWAGPGQVPPAGSWSTAPAAPPAHARRGLVAGLLAGSLVAGVAAGAALGIARQDGRSPSSTGVPPAVAAVPPGDGSTIPGTGGSGPSGSGGSGVASGSGATSSGTTLDAAAIAAKVDPAVVDITATEAGGVAAGTGMVITSSGEVLTNNHVVANALRITVQIAGTGPQHPATVLGVDPTDDVALLKIQGVSGLTAVTTGDSAQVSVGDAVLALGNALGQGGTPAAAQGVVTAVNQTITAADEIGSAETLTGLIETDASIQPGDSGGPLVDATGRVIGMDTAASVGGRFRQQSSAGYAIPIDAAMSIVRDIESGGGSPNVQTGQRAMIGVEVQDGAGGATVAGVEGGTPAAAAGLQTGDVITGLAGRSITSASSLQTAMSSYRPGDRVTVTWLDPSGASHSATVQLAAGPPA